MYEQYNIFKTDLLNDQLRQARFQSYNNFFRLTSNYYSHAII